MVITAIEPDIGGKAADQGFVSQYPRPGALRAGALTADAVALEARKFAETEDHI